MSTENKINNLDIVISRNFKRLLQQYSVERLSPFARKCDLDQSQLTKLRDNKVPWRSTHMQKVIDGFAEYGHTVTYEQLVTDIDAKPNETPEDRIERLEKIVHSLINKDEVPEKTGTDK